MRLLLAVLVVSGLLMAPGCGPKAEPNVVVGEGDRKEAPDLPVASRTQSAPDAERPEGINAEYANWNRFPIGTEVKRKEVTQGSGTTVTSVKTWRLIEKTNEIVKIEWQVTTERSDGFKAENPTNQTTFAKNFRVPQGMKLEDFAKPSLNAKETGTEKVAVLGKDYQARVFEWKNSTEGGEMLIKAWLADEFPGRVIRQEMNVPALKRTTTDEVVEVKLPK